MIRIFSADGCPFAHRTRALLTHLEEPFELREVDLDDRDPELLELSPTGRVPFMVDGDLRLYESVVINDYLAERLAFSGAYSEDTTVRALERLVVRRWDDVVVPAFYRSLGAPGVPADELRESLGRELGFLAGAASRIGADAPADTVRLVSIHVATHWTRMSWLRELTSLHAVLDEHAELRSWLDRAADIPAVRETSPDEDETVEHYRRRYVEA